MKNIHKLSIFTLAMINVAAIVSLKNLPVMAEYGVSLIFYFFLATLFFFLPTSLVSAELATGWPKRGGVYIWVKEAFGPKWGFIAIWLQWVENVIWYPTILSFVAATIAYIFNPSLAENKLYTLMIIFTAFWGMTIVNFFGMKASGWISSFSAIVGTLIPGTTMILLAIFWAFGGHQIQIDFTFSAIFPDLGQISHLVFLVGVMLSLAGMEMSAVHAEEVQKPQRDYPKAILLSALIILILSILGSLAIAIVVPKQQLSLVAGVMEAFSFFFNAYQMPFLVPVIALLTALGALGMVSTWIVGPSKGLLATGHQGDLPPIFQKMNAQNMPVPLMILQGLIVTALSSVFLFMPTVSSSYWILSALTAQLYLLMYILMFLSALILRYKASDHPRAYKIPGGNYGMWLVSTIGIIGAFFAIGIGFIPPVNFPKKHTYLYVGFLLCAMFIMCVIPILITFFKSKKWKGTQ